MQPTPTAAAKKMKRDGRLVRQLIKLVAKADLPERIETDPDRPTIAAGNHQSLLDVFLAVAFCHTADVSCRLMVQERYFGNAIAGRWLRRLGCIATSADNKDEAFGEVRAALGRGELVGIMPEGRLTKPEDRDPQVGPGRPGVAQLARESGALVRPITFHNTGTAWPRGGFPRLRFRRPVVTMRLGDPIALTGETDDENTVLIMAGLTRALDDLDTEVFGDPSS